MLNAKTLAAKIAVSLVAVGSLAGAGAGVAAAGTPPTNPHGSSAHATAARERSCRSLGRRESFAVRNQARFAARTARFAALAAKAQKDGNTQLAKYWNTVVAHRDATSARKKASLAARVRADAKRHTGKRTC